MARRRGQDLTTSERSFATVQRRSTRLAEKEEGSVNTGINIIQWADAAVAFGERHSIALKSGLHVQPIGQTCPDGFACEPPPTSDTSGLWNLLPEELIETVLKLCTPVQLGMLQSTCAYFHDSQLIDKIAKHKLKAVPRARGLKPCKREHETHLALLHFVNCQSAAAAQATAIACGGHHTSSLLINGDVSSSQFRHTLYTFGRNFHGQLGISDFDNKNLPSSVSLGFRTCQDNADLEEETMPAVVACGTHYSACISRRGELFSWGLGKSGELGQGRWALVEVAIPKQCPLPQVRIVSVACGSSHMLAIGESGSLWSCGKNSSGQLGHGNLVDSYRLQMVQNLPGSRIVSAAAGSSHSVALASDGSLFTWGDGSCGQLGHWQLHAIATANLQNSITMLLPQKINRLDPSVLSPENRVTAISSGNFHTMALTVGGSILAFGGNESGCLGLADYDNRWKPTKVNLSLSGEESICVRAVQLACGAGHTIALVSKQGCLEVRTTGINTRGQLGLGDRKQRSQFTPTSRILHVTAVQAGDEHTAAVTEDGYLYMWGRGDSGQLGMGDARGRTKPTLMKGFTVVHPDKTLRRSKRNQPFVRSIIHEKKRQRISSYLQ